MLAGLVDRRQDDLVLPVAAGGAGADVLHGPAHLDGAPLLGGGRGADAGDGQVGRRREVDRERRRDRDVVGAVAVDELERRVVGRRGDDEVVGAAQAVGQGDLGRADVALAGADRPEVVEQAVVLDDVLAGRVAGQGQVVIPGRHAGQADPLVLDRPGDVQRLAAAGRLRHVDRRDDEVGIRDRHHVEVVRVLADVVGPQAVLEDHVAGVGLDEQVVAPGEARRHGERLRLGVALVDGQAAGVDERAQHDGIRVGDVVGRRRDDRVGPGGRLAGTRADVGDRPGDRGIGRVADRLRRGDDVADGQVGIGGERDVDRLAGRVRRAVRLDELVGRVGDDDDLVGAAVPQRDGRAGRRVDALCGGQRPGDRDRAQQERAARHLAGGREVGAIDPAGERRRRAVVRRGPLHRQDRAGGRGRRGREDRRDEVDVAEGQGLGRGRLVVGPVGIGGDGVAGIGHDDHLVTAVGEAARQRGGERAIVARAAARPAVSATEPSSVASPSWPSGER